MDRMIKDFREGESCIFANSLEDYCDFVDWLGDEGAIFACHFGSGEGFTYNGKMIEVYGL